MMKVEWPFCKTILHINVVILGEQLCKKTELKNARTDQQRGLDCLKTPHKSDLPLPRPDETVKSKKYFFVKMQT